MEATRDQIAKELERLTSTVLPLRKKIRMSIAESDVENLGCTPAQFQVLWHLSHHRPWRMSDLAQHLAVSQASLTIMVDRLIADNLVERTRSQTDRRVVLVSLTDKGMGVVSNYRQLVLKRSSALVDRFSEAEQDELLKALTTTIGYLEKMKES
ncbi:MAG: MarR family transcriptional regulator [Bacillota bacterium]